MKINLGKVFDTGGGGREPIVEALSVTENGTYTPNEGVDGFNPVEVNVQPPLQTKAIEITANGQSTIEADSEYYGLESVGVNVNVPTPEPNLQAKSIEIVKNGTQTIGADEGYDGLSSVEVSTNVPTPEPNLQEKTTSQRITTNGTSTITVSPDSGYDGLSSANVTITTNVTASMPTLVLEHSTNSRSFGYFISGDADLRFCDTSNITTLYEMFKNCSNLTSLDISGWDTSKVTSMNSMFKNCSNLTSLDISGWDTSKVTSMGYMFDGCSSLTSLDLSGWDTSNAISVDVESMFYSCKNLVSIDFGNFKPILKGRTYNMFNGCSSLTSLDLSGWDTSAVTDASTMFRYCNNLTSLDLSNWNMSKVTNTINMFGGYYGTLTSLTNLNMTNAILPKMDLTEWGLNFCSKLTVDSLVSVLNALPQLDAGQSFTCTLGSTNLAKLSDDQKSIATNKGWTLN